MFLCFFNGGRYSFFINTLNSVIFLECKCKKIIVKKELSVEIILNIVD